MRAVLALSAIVSLLYSTSREGALAASYRESLVDAHLVVRGVVEEVSAEYVSHDRGVQGLPEEFRSRPIVIWRVRLGVVEVMKGRYEGASLELAVYRISGPYPLTLKSSENYILCLWYDRSLGGGSFAMSSGLQAFKQSGDSWFSCADSSEVPLDSIRATIETTGPAYVIANAELVAVGEIGSTETSSIVGPNGERARVRECTMHVSTVLKGHLDADTLSFGMIMKGRYEPAWRAAVPRKMNVGETWYVFLKKGEIGYYPFAGKNGLLKLQDAQLIYDNAVPYAYTPAEIDQLIEEDQQ